MTKYHINHRGNPGRCRARHACPFGGVTEHYVSKDAARDAYEGSQGGSFNQGQVDRRPTLANLDLDDLLETDEYGNYAYDSAILEVKDPISGSHLYQFLAKESDVQNRIMVAPFRSAGFARPVDESMLGSYRLVANNADEVPDTVRKYLDFLYEEVYPVADREMEDKISSIGAHLDSKTWRITARDTEKFDQEQRDKAEFVKDTMERLLSHSAPDWTRHHITQAEDDYWQGRTPDDLDSLDEYSYDYYDAEHEYSGDQSVEGLRRYVGVSFLNGYVSESDAAYFYANKIREMQHASATEAEETASIITKSQKKIEEIDAKLAVFPEGSPLAEPLLRTREEKLYAIEQGKLMIEQLDRDYPQI